MSDLREQARDRRLEIAQAVAAIEAEDKLSADLGKRKWKESELQRLRKKLGTDPVAFSQWLSMEKVARQEGRVTDDVSRSIANIPAGPGGWKIHSFQIGILAAFETDTGEERERLRRGGGRTLRQAAVRVIDKLMAAGAVANVPSSPGLICLECLPPEIRQLGAGIQGRTYKVADLPPEQQGAGGLLQVAQDRYWRAAFKAWRSLLGDEVGGTAWPTWSQDLVWPHVESF